MPFRKFDDQRIGQTLRPVVLIELLPQLPGLHPDRRIRFRIVGIRLPESLNPNRILLEILRLALQFLAPEILEQTAQNLARMECTTLQNPL